MKPVPTALLPLALALIACTTPIDRLTVNAATCQSWGFQAGTQIFLDCATELTRLDAQIAALQGAPTKHNTLSDIGHVLTSTANGIRDSQPQTDGGPAYPAPRTFRSGAVEAIDRAITNCLRRGEQPNC